MSEMGVNSRQSWRDSTDNDAAKTLSAELAMLKSNS